MCTSVNPCSDIATASIGPRSVVATSAEELRVCQWEVEEDTERFIQTAEVRQLYLLLFIKANASQRIVCPYSWTTYNILVLPPSFPCPSKINHYKKQTDKIDPDGGMENPQYTFATPTFITGVSNLVVYRHIELSAS